MDYNFIDFTSPEIIVEVLSLLMAKREEFEARIKGVSDKSGTFQATISWADRKHYNVCFPAFDLEDYGFIEKGFSNFRVFTDVDWEEGTAPVYEEGYDEGFHEGKNEGLTEAYNKGYNDGAIGEASRVRPNY